MPFNRLERDIANDIERIKANRLDSNHVRIRAVPQVDFLDDSRFKVLDEDIFRISLQSQIFVSEGRLYMLTFLKVENFRIQANTLVDAREHQVFGSNFERPNTLPTYLVSQNGLVEDVMRDRIVLLND